MNDPNFLVFFYASNSLSECSKNCKKKSIDWKIFARTSLKEVILQSPSDGRKAEKVLTKKLQGTSKTAKRNVEIGKFISTLYKNCDRFETMSRSFLTGCVKAGPNGLVRRRKLKRLLASLFTWPGLYK